MLPVFIFLSLHFAFSTVPSGLKQPRKVILDCDPGSDDALALIWLAQAVRTNIIELLAITTIGGNLDPKQTCSNAFRLAKTLGLTNTKIGCNLISKIRSDDYYSGDGLNGASKFLDKADVPTDVETASDVLQEFLKKYPGEITILSAGPHTNIADLLDSYQLKELVMMGGSLYGGNVTPYSEFNFWSDGTSAHVTFSSEFTNFVMFPLEVTMSSCAEGQLDALAKAVTLKPAGRGERLLQFIQTSLFSPSASKANILFVQECTYAHDAMTVGYIVNPYVYKYQRMAVSVTIEGEVRARQNPEEYSEPNTWVATEVDATNFWMTMRKDILKLVISLDCDDGDWGNCADHAKDEL